MLYGLLVSLLLVIGSVFFDEVRPSLWILAACFPLVAVCDAFRYFGSILGRAYLSACLEILRLFLFIGGFAVLLADKRHDTAQLIALWCACAVIVGVVGLTLGERMTRPARADMRQFATVKFLGYQFSLEYLMGVFARTIPTLSLGWFVSVTAIGYFRGMSTLFGPILVLATSAVLVISPYLVANPGPKRVRVLVAMGSLFSFASLAWMTVLLFLPDRWGQEVLGEVWGGSRSLIVPIALQMVGTGILTTAQTGVRVVRPRYSFVMNLSAVSWFFICFAIGVTLGGLHGAAWGFAIGAFGAAAIAVGIFVKIKDSPAEEA